MHLSDEQADQPQANSTSKPKRRADKYDKCPDCGKPKRTVSRRCRQCGVNSRRIAVSTEIFYIDGEPCRYIALTKGQKAIVDASRYNELSRYNWYAVFNKGMQRYYAYRTEACQDVTLHRHVLNFPQSAEVDHKNHDTLDNRISNLRPCTSRQNQANRRKTANTSSRFRGVCWDGTHQIWQVHIRINSVQKTLGYRRDEEAAARLYDIVAIQQFGVFAQLNFPLSDYQ